MCVSIAMLAQASKRGAHNPPANATMKRSVAKPAVGVKEYITALTTFKTVGQFACLDDVVPKMTSESRGVRPADIIGLARLFEYLLLNGASNGMFTRASLKRQQFAG